MDGRPTWTDCDEAGDYVVPNVLNPRDLVFRPDNMDETVPHTGHVLEARFGIMKNRKRKMFFFLRIGMKTELEWFRILYRKMASYTLLNN